LGSGLDPETAELMRDMIRKTQTEHHRICQRALARIVYLLNERAPIPDRMAAQDAERIAYAALEGRLVDGIFGVEWDEVETGA